MCFIHTSNIYIYISKLVDFRAVWQRLNGGFSLHFRERRPSVISWRKVKRDEQRDILTLSMAFQFFAPTPLPLPLLREIFHRSQIPLSSILMRRMAGQQRAVMNINRCLIRAQQGERELTLRKRFYAFQLIVGIFQRIEFSTCNYFLPGYGRFCNSLYVRSAFSSPCFTFLFSTSNDRRQYWFL